MNIKCVILVSLSLLVGCSHTREFSSYDEINLRTKGKTSIIKLSQGNDINAKELEITPDYIY